MSVMDVLKKGADYTNVDETAKGMMADFNDHKVGLQLDADEVTQVVKDGALSLEEGVREARQGLWAEPHPGPSWSGAPSRQSVAGRMRNSAPSFSSVST